MSRPRSDKPATTVDCPTCGQPVTWGADAPERPFCSRRCRLIDLGEWLDGRHAIPGEDSGGITDHPDDGVDSSRD